MRFSISLGVLAALAAPSFGQIIDPYYSGSYSLGNLGSVPGVPPNYGGLLIRAGTQNTLWIGGAANSLVGVIYEIQVSRDGDGHINGFIGEAVPRLTAPYNDGGIAYHPTSGVLFYSMWPVNYTGQFKPGSTVADKVINMADLGMAASHASLNFLPLWFGSQAGNLLMCSWGGGQFYTSNYSPDGFGTFNIDSINHVRTLEGGPEGFLYVPPNSPLFPNYSMLVSEYSAGKVAAYEVDQYGIPDLGTRRVFVDELYGAEGAFIDPVTGDFLFSTFGGFNQVVVVRGFASQPIIRGNVVLQDYVVPPSTQPVTFQIFNEGSFTPLETHTVSPDDDGDYSFATAVGPGDYDMTAKAPHWLRQRVSSITVTGSGASGVNYSLINGDTDPDNEVNLVDFGQISAAFGSISGDPNWNPNADLDGDGEVTLVDYGILAARFGQAGDE